MATSATHPRASQRPWQSKHSAGVCRTQGGRPHAPRRPLRKQTRPYFSRREGFGARPVPIPRAHVSGGHAGLCFKVWALEADGSHAPAPAEDGEA